MWQLSLSLGELDRHRDQIDAAIAALRIYETTGQASHPVTRIIRLAAAKTYLELGQRDEALELPLRTFDASDSPSHLREVWRLLRSLSASSPSLAPRVRELAQMASEAGEPDLGAEIGASLVRSEREK